MKWIVISIFLIIGLCYAELDSDSESEESLPDIPDIDDIIKERCNIKAGEGTYERLKIAKDETQTCIEAIIDVNKVKNEVEEAKKTGSMDEVFGKYCGKRPEIRECLKGTIEVAKECMEESEKRALNITTDILEKIGDFVCYRDGDRIAMFVAEGGVECLKSRVEGIKKCVNETLKIDPASLSTNSLSGLSTGQNKCNDLNTIQECMVKDLEDGCKDPTPANIVDALFRFIKRTACKNERQKRRINLKREIRSAVASTAVQQYQTNLIEKLNNTCQKYGGKDAYNKLTDSFKGTKTCIANGNNRFLATPKTKFISTVTNCSNNLIVAFKHCLPEESKYYPEFIRDRVLSLVEFAYDHSDLFKKSMKNQELINCFQNLKREEIKQKFAVCLKDADGHDKNGQLLEPPPKEELCGKITILHNCVTKLVKETCVVDVQINQILQDYITAFEKPCHETPSE